ncbi:Protein bicaudal C [Echinococcus granulosus]|uniref:Protein bicaudal C n=1 Tax=Echinococcus granulosus TaxID=6210 RepID=W6UNB5_ECHGR|nr:Protein bicaudal C [Echinococcus granulosus]EUB59707.1 Protein bicaudal C [Echinococcus granulosus]
MVLAKTHDEGDKYLRIPRACEKKAINEATEPVLMGEAVTTGLTCPAVAIEDRVTMKLDVAHTEHSHLIGKGGHCVKAMMLETQCHIHFPDSNRAPNVVEKSNQVSISGQSADVERARKRIRQMLPLVYIFTIQNSSPHALTLYRTSYIVQHLEAKFSVEVTYRHYFAFPLADLTFRHHPHAKYLASSSTIVVSVRGLALFAQHVIEATKTLLEHHFGRMAEHTNVWMTLDVEPKHQFIMQNHMAPRSLVEVIHESTGAWVWFPQESPFTNTITSSITTISPCPSPLSRSPRRSGFYAPRLCPTPSLPTSSISLSQRPEARTMITIFGSVNGCFVARQTLMTLLPVTLIAEISSEEALILSRIDYSTYKSSNDVSISFRAKPRHSFREVQKGVATLPPLEACMTPSLNEKGVASGLEKEASLRRQRWRYPVLGGSFATWASESRSPSPKSPILRPPISLENGDMTSPNTDHFAMPSAANPKYDHGQRKAHRRLNRQPKNLFIVLT